MDETVEVVLQPDSDTDGITGTVTGVKVTPHLPVIVIVIVSISKSDGNSAYHLINVLTDL